MESYFDLGSHSRLITTASADAQVWFNRGLNWLYGFNHPEAVACFQRAAVCDPACAMAHWGIALAKGPYINKQWSKMFQSCGSRLRGKGQIHSD
jgi:hypothetical protein